METTSPDSSRLGISAKPQPSPAPSVKRVPPLRVTKRSSSNLSHAQSDVEDQGLRSFSQRTDNSLKSIVEQLAVDDQLTIPKIRGNRNNRRFEYSAEPEGYLVRRSLDDASVHQAISPSLNNSISHRNPGPIDTFLCQYTPENRYRSIAQDESKFQGRYTNEDQNTTSYTTYNTLPKHIDNIQPSQYFKMVAQRAVSPAVSYYNDGLPDDPFLSPGSEHKHGLAPHLLIPEVAITPDARNLDNGYRNFWVSVEISVRLHWSGGACEGSSECIPPRNQRLAGFAGFDLNEHGCIHDVQVDIKPTVNSQVLEVIEHEASPRSFKPGDKSLVLVNVELNTTNYSRLRGHIRSQSDELMEDLENQLGSTQCEYLKVNIIYRHSVFSSMMNPVHLAASQSSGVVDTQTQLCTTFTAATNRYNAASFWSPPPAPTPNRLLGIIAAH